MKIPQKIKIGVAMSGGVDSSVAAALLKKSGFDIFGIFMKLWTDDAEKENRCCSLESEKKARQVAKSLGIPFYIINAEREFKKAVVDEFLKDSRIGLTPNPCVVCNRDIKFGLLMEKAEKMGADFLATGHYARIKNGNLHKGNDPEKDQSYFLWMLEKNQLDKIMFPVGGYNKTEVRKLAKKFKLATAESPESQEACFVSGKMADFLKKHIKNQPGEIVDDRGRVLGNHRGLWFYTIGQRRGIELANGPYFVIGKDKKKNRLIVSKDQRNLIKKEIAVFQVNWAGEKPKLPCEAMVKIRYRSSPAKAIISKGKSGLILKFKTGQRAATCGQSAVFYKGTRLMGGGIIK